MILHWPLAPEFRRITQGFGEVSLRYTQFSLRGHPGLDFGVAVGTPVMAANDGYLVTGSGAQLGCQCWVVAEWGQTFYSHLDRTTPPRRVKAGEIIAYSGNTGTETTGAHLHFEVHPFPRDMINGFKGAIDPLPLLQEGERAMEKERVEATAIRFEIEVIERLEEEAEQHDGNIIAERAMSERCRRQARMKLKALIDTKNGRAYRLEGLLGGALPVGWEG